MDSRTSYTLSKHKLTWLQRENLSLGHPVMGSSLYFLWLSKIHYRVQESRHWTPLLRPSQSTCPVLNRWLSKRPPLKISDAVSTRRVHNDRHNAFPRGHSRGSRGHDEWHYEHDTDGGRCVVSLEWSSFQGSKESWNGVDDCSRVRYAFYISVTGTVKRKKMAALSSWTCVINYPLPHPPTLTTREPALQTSSLIYADVYCKRLAYIASYSLHLSPRSKRTLFNDVASAGRVEYLDT